MLPIKMSDLIVDFPNYHHVVPRSKAVQFSIMTQIHFIANPIDDSDVCHRWYSSKDYKEMRAANKQVVRQVHKRYGTMSSSSCPSDPSGNDEQGDTYLNGIENILSPSVIKKTKVRRLQCTNAVLAEQERQYHAGVNDLEAN